MSDIRADATISGDAGEQIAEILTDAVDDVIQDQEQRARDAELARDAIIEAMIASEREQSLRERFDHAHSRIDMMTAEISECRLMINQISEQLAAMTLALSTLTLSSQLNAEDGRKENLEAENPPIPENLPIPTNELPPSENDPKPEKPRRKHILL